VACSISWASRAEEVGAVHEPEHDQLPPEQIKHRMREGRFVGDAVFDAWLPESVRAPSGRYWTQVGVAMRVTRWLSARGAARVLDIGSGAGKFCVVGALSSELSFTGVEQRGHLVAAARELALRFGVETRANFIQGDLDTLDVRDFDALYLYNPFGENIFPACGRLDDTVEVSRKRFQRDTTRMAELLGRMPVDSLLVTYNGCGARIPDSFELVHEKVAGICLLRLWRKARERSSGGYWLELDEATLLRRATRSS
jgi:hypothetical protein